MICTDTHVRGFNAVVKLFEMFASLQIRNMAVSMFLLVPEICISVSFSIICVNIFQTKILVNKGPIRDLLVKHHS